MIVENKQGRQLVKFADGRQYDCLGYVGETRVGYLCSVDFQHEMGEHVIRPTGKPSGTQVYDSLEDLKAARSCVMECGYTKVLLVVLEVDKADSL